MSSKRTTLIRVFVVALVVGATAAAYVYQSRTSPHGGHMPPQGGEMKTPDGFVKADEAVGEYIRGEFPMTDQDGEPFEVSEWFDKPLIVSYIFTECGHICPTITASLDRFVENHRDMLGRDFRLVSVGFDPVNDTPEAMRKFGGEFAESFDNWKFVTGDEKVVKELADKLGIVYKYDEEQGWQHTMAVTIMGPGGMVFRQIFGVDYTDNQLLEPVKLAMTGVSPKAVESFMGH